MSDITWITPKNSLGTIVEGEYFEAQLDAVDSAGSILTFALVAGRLANGLQISPTGLIYGIPLIDLTVISKSSFTKPFTIRITNVSGQIADRTFFLTINPVALPQIYPQNVSLGTYVDSKYVDIQLTYTDVNPIVTPTWKLLSGELPRGTQLTSSGQIYGYILPSVQQTNISLVGWDSNSWDFSAWDTMTAESQMKNYIFTVEVFDGSRYNKTTYAILVMSSKATTIDSTLITIDSSLTNINSSALRVPFITSAPQALTTQRQLNEVALPIYATDLDKSTINFSSLTVSTTLQTELSKLPALRKLSPQLAFLQNVPSEEIVYSMPPGISINPATGWITGQLALQTLETITYVFAINCFKSTVNGYISDPVVFSMTVLGSENNVINWVTPSNLGFINNGQLSDLSVQAVGSLNQTLTYSLIGGLPPGLKLLANGLIVGRVNFAMFSLDHGTTTLDGKITGFDSSYTFTVEATDGVLHHRREFTLRIDVINYAPYEDLYLRALPTKAQRTKFTDIMKDTTVFPTELIYRKEDPWFGLAEDLRFLFAPGLNQVDAATHINNMKNSHYPKTINLGNVKTAIATDANSNIKYEVVYVEVTDQSSANTTPTTLIDRTNQVSGIYKNPPYNIISPNTLLNMKTEVNAAGISNPGAMPDWMLAPQRNGLVLGFTYGIVLAYTVPGASELIAYRLKQSGVMFEDLDFRVDRYQLASTTNDYALPEDGETYITFPRTNIYG